MEITERELRALTRDVDDAHRESIVDFPGQIAELHHGAGKALRIIPRRRIIPALAIGGASIPLLGWARAAAQSGDAGLAAFAESVELAAVAAYEAAAGSGKVTTPAVGEAATLFAGHHAEHAAAFGAAAGDAATGVANPGLLQAVGAQLEAAADEAAVLRIAYDLENSAAATYLFALGALTSPAALALTASILPVEAQHAVVLGQALALPATDFIPPFETKETAVTPDDFPI